MGNALRNTTQEKPYFNIVSGTSRVDADAGILPARPPRLALTPKPRLSIVHVSSTVAPTTGGPATVIVRLAAAQAAMGHEVSLVSALHAADREMFETAARNIPHFERVRLLLSPWTGALENRFGWRNQPLYESTFPYADIVHIHGVWEPTLVMAAATARKLKVPYIVRPYGVLDPWSLQQHSLKKKIGLLLAHKKMLDGAALIHTLNREEYSLISPLHIAARRTIIPNGVFLDEIDDTPSDERFMDRFPALRTHPYILFLARLHQKKGLDILAGAFARIAALHPDVHLLVAGPDGGAREAFIREIQAQQLEGRVHLTGPLVGGEKSAAFRNAACFCLPSRQEGFSLSIIEAMATHVPVAISEECHFPEVEECGAGRVFPLNAADAAGSLHDILSMAAPGRRRMGAAGRAYVEAHLTWERVAELTTEAYEGILERV